MALCLSALLGVALPAVWLQLFLYNGSGANRAEKAKALELLHRIRDSERGGKAQVVIVNEVRWIEQDEEEVVWRAD